MILCPHEIDRDPADFNVEDGRAEDPTEFLEAVCMKCGHEVQAACPDCGTYVRRNDTDRPEQFYERASYHALLLLLERERNTRFAIDCYFIATGDAIMDGRGRSMAEVAKRWSVTRAMVSKHCRRICRTLRIIPSRYMRSEEAAIESKLRNRRKHKPK